MLLARDKKEVIVPHLARGKERRRQNWNTIHPKSDLVLSSVSTIHIQYLPIHIHITIDKPVLATEPMITAVAVTK